MSRFFSEKYSALTPYVPGEQPNNTIKYTKLNTNESPFPPSEKAKKYALENTRELNLYSDPNVTELTKKLAEIYGVENSQVLVTNGSDEILNFAFMAFCDKEHPAVFPDITYGFYEVFAQVNNIPYKVIPLKDDYSVCAGDYLNAGGTIFIANPNAPTGMTISLADIENILKANPDNVVVIDEAYVDFGGNSAVSLVNKYENLLVCQTFSKSRSMAGARLGYGIGSKQIISDLNTIKYSTNPYNINSMTMAMGLGTLLDSDYTERNCATIIENRKYSVDEMEKRGFNVLPSCANFIFAQTDRIDGGELYAKLKERGVLVRHFTKPRISNFNRITIGTKEQMDILLCNIDAILGEKE